MPTKNAENLRRLAVFSAFVNRPTKRCNRPADLTACMRRAFDVQSEFSAIQNEIHVTLLVNEPKSRSGGPSSSVGAKYTTSLGKPPSQVLQAVNISLVNTERCELFMEIQVGKTSGVIARINPGSHAAPCNGFASVKRVFYYVVCRIKSSLETVRPTINGYYYYYYVLYIAVMG
jgi:hypothetical protein